MLIEINKDTVIEYQERNEERGVPFLCGFKHDGAYIEKADINYDGVYQVIVQEFAKMFAGDVKYINREEDCGDEGLRRSKQSYRPVDLLKKYSVKAKCHKCS